MSVVTATTDRELGTRPSRRLRREGRIPAVLYGQGGENLTLSIDYRDLRDAVQGELGLNTIFTLEVDGDSQQVIIQDLQRDPIKRSVRHVDLLRVAADTPVKVSVPVKLVGDGSRITETGGRIEQKIFQLDVTVTGLDIPAVIEADVSHLTFDDRIAVGDLELPNGVVSRIPDRLTIAAPVVPKGRALPGEEGEGEEGEETAEGDGDAAASEGGDDAEASED